MAWVSAYMSIHSCNELVGCGAGGGIAGPRLRAQRVVFLMSFLFHGSEDLFHWACINERAAQLPRNTAPAGYQCPSCNGPIFPSANLAGPVASALREKLATVNWARAGLGLPLVRVPLSVWPSVCPDPHLSQIGWVGSRSGQTTNLDSFLEIDEVISPEPEPLNSSDFSDWSSFNGKWWPPSAAWALLPCSTDSSLPVHSHQPPCARGDRQHLCCSSVLQPGSPPLLFPKPS